MAQHVVGEWDLLILNNIRNKLNKVVVLISFKIFIQI
jgi:hypothetical protein